MSRLLVNVGNTHCVAARLAGCPREGGIERLHEDRIPKTGHQERALLDCLFRMRRAGEPVAVASVVPRVTSILADGLPDAHFVDHTWDFPFGNKLESCQTVGADRWCNVAAAAFAGLDDALIVDAGTATTFDSLSQGVFEGGLIAPGMSFAAGQIQEFAPGLRPVPFQPWPLRPGRNTDEALGIGAFHVGIHGVVGTILALLDQWPGSEVVLTGGLALHLHRPGWLHDPDWTMRGLAVLLDRRTAPDGR